MTWNCNVFLFRLHLLNFNAITLECSANVRYRFSPTIGSLKTTLLAWLRQRFTVIEFSLDYHAVEIVSIHVESFSSNLHKSHVCHRYESIFVYFKATILRKQCYFCLYFVTIFANVLINRNCICSKPERKCHSGYCKYSPAEIC